MASKMLEISSDKFRWHSAGNATAEISDLRLDGFPHTFMVRSTRTGDRRMFISSERITMGQGEDEELGGYVYICPGSGLPAISIFND